MKHGGKLQVCVAAGIAFCTTANAIPTDSSETSENPYQSIVDRNVFSLKPPPTPLDPTEVNKPVTVKITLTGITTILGNKRVLMKTAPQPGKPGEGPKTEQSYILTEGQREGDIEVIQIDEKAGSVKVNNGGAVQTLTFEKDGAKLPATPAPVVPGGIPGVQPIPGLPVSHPAPQLPGTATPGFQLPTRVPRLPAVGAQASAANPGGMNLSPGYLPGNSTTPILPGSTGPGGTTITTPAGVTAYSPEEQAILIEAARQSGGPAAALLPPTPITPKANVNQPPGQTQTPTITLPPLPGRVPGSY